MSQSGSFRTSQPGTFSSAVKAKEAPARRMSGTAELSSASPTFGAPSVSVLITEKEIKKINKEVQQQIKQEALFNAKQEALLNAKKIFNLE